MDRAIHILSTFIVANNSKFECQTFANIMVGLRDVGSSNVWCGAFECILCAPFLWLTITRSQCSVYCTCQRLNWRVRLFPFSSLLPSFYRPPHLHKSAMIMLMYEIRQTEHREIFKIPSIHGCISYTWHTSSGESLSSLSRLRTFSWKNEVAWNLFVLYPQ